MSGFGYGLAGFASGINSGLSTGQRLYDLVQQDDLAKVRAQGIAEAQAAQAAATPKITDIGDQDNLSSSPQSSADPAQQQPINTSLSQFVANANQGQTAQDPNRDAVQTSPVATPDAPQDTSQLSSTPVASAAPDAPAGDAQSAFTNGITSASRKRFNVGGQGFDSQEEAAAYVKKQTPQLESFFHDTLVPKMTAALVAQGKIDQAQAWEKYADEEQTRQNMATWGKAVQLSQYGDYNGAAEQLIKLHPHFDDGYDLVSAEPTKGENGEDGFTLNIKGPDGKTQQMYQNAKSLTELGLAQLAPGEMFAQRYKRQTQADQMQARAAIDAQNDERTLNRQLTIAGLNTSARQKAVETQVAGRKEVAQTNNDSKDQRQKTAIEARLAQAREGWAAAAQRDANKIAADGQYRKSVSPEERTAIIVTSLSKDPMFNMLTPEQKQQRIADTMALIPKAGSQSTAAKPAATVANPMSNGISQPSADSNAPAGKVKVPVFQDGKIVYVYR